MSDTCKVCNGEGRVNNLLGNLACGSCQGTGHRDKEDETFVEDVQRQLSPDMVNHPPHYKTESGLEAIDVIEAFGLDKSFCLGNAAKYLLRAGKKGDRIEDLRKCAWYIAREIESATKATN